MLQLYREAIGRAIGALRRRHHHIPITLRRNRRTPIIPRRPRRTLTIPRKTHPTLTILRRPRHTPIQLKLTVLLVGQISLRAKCAIDHITEIVTKTSVYEKPTTYTTTKTVVIPVTTVAEYPETIETAVEYTSTGYSTKVRITALQFVHQLTAHQTYTDYETELETKTYSTVSVITTTIYTTKVESDVKTKTELKTVPYT